MYHGRFYSFRPGLDIRIDEPQGVLEDRDFRMELLWQSTLGGRSQAIESQTETAFVAYFLKNHGGFLSHFFYRGTASLGWIWPALFVEGK